MTGAIVVPSESLAAFDAMPLAWAAALRDSSFSWAICAAVRDFDLSVSAVGATKGSVVVADMAVNVLRKAPKALEPAPLTSMGGSRF